MTVTTPRGGVPPFVGHSRSTEELSTYCGFSLKSGLQACDISFWPLCSVKNGPSKKFIWKKENYKAYVEGVGVVF